MPAARSAQLAFLLALALPGASAAASAAEPAFLVEFGPEVKPADRAQVLSLLTLELGAEVAEVAATGPTPDRAQDRATVSIRALHAPASADGGVWSVAIVSREAPRKAEQEIDLKDVPAEARARGLALSIAEMVRAVRRAPAAAAPQPPAPVAPLPAPEVLEPVRHGFTLGVGAGVRAYPALGATLADPRVELGWSSGPLALALDLGTLAGYCEDPLGEIRVVVPTLGLQVGLARSLSRAWFELGPRVELGWAVISGVPGDSGAAGSSASSFVLDVSLQARGRVSATDRFWLELGLEAGYGLVGLEARADGRRAVGVGGPMVGVGLALGADLNR